MLQTDNRQLTEVVGVASLRSTCYWKPRTLKLKSLKVTLQLSVNATPNWSPEFMMAQLVG